MSVCTANEIAEKRRIALAKLQAKKAQASTTNSNTKSSSTHSPQLSAKTTSNFYRSPSPNSTKATTNNNNNKQNKSTTFLNALKAIKTTSTRELSRASAHPYQRNNGPQKPTLSLSPDKKQPAVGALAHFNTKHITCRVYLISAQRFAVASSGYHEQLIQVFKNIPSKSYNAQTHNWDFDLKDYQLLQRQVAELNPYVVIGSIPKKVIDLCREPQKPLERSVLASIDSTLGEKLMPFQEEGVCFSIAQQGRIMICDEMGLGKTYQALAVADYFKEDWPLLICTTASTRDSWARHINQLLPSVPVACIQVLNNSNMYVSDAQVLITSYNMMERYMDKLLQRKFGCCIFDESHTLKNGKAKCTVVAKRLADQAKRVILLSGTPALSRPLELFTQLQLVDGRFMNFMEFTTRYCDGKQAQFGWDANGQSNLDELKVILTHKYMLRRTKAEVLPQLAEKNRETVVLDPALIWNDDVAKTTCNEMNNELQKAKGRNREELLLRFYARTAEVKTRAVCAYLKTLVAEKIKFIIFAHHRVMLDAISDCLTSMRVSYIRIDGQTRSDLRADYVDTFQKKSSCKAAVLSLKACNSGITLTAAELIVFAELDWNPSTLAQAESRAHRIGQTKPVVCRYLMASQTADDTIWNMLKNKQEVLNKVGIFAENLQEATHKAAPTMSNKIEQYFSPSKPTIKTESALDWTDAITEKPKQEKQHEVNQHQEQSYERPVVDTEKDIAAFFNEDDDEAFKDLVF